MTQQSRAYRNLMNPRSLCAVAAFMLSNLGSPAHAEALKYLECKARHIKGFGLSDDSKTEPASNTYHFGFDDQAQKFVEANNSTWYLPGTDTSPCRVSISPAAVNVSCEPGPSSRLGFFWIIKISRTIGSFEYTVGTVGEGGMRGTTTTGMCSLLPSDPLVPSKRLF